MARDVDVIISQGRVGDRTTGALPGARRTGEALASLLSVDPRIVGTPSAAATDDWSQSLPAASDTLTALRETLRESLDAGRVPVLATNTCGASIGTLPTVAERFPDAVVLWIDAHGDFNTPQTTESGYQLLDLHGITVLAPAESTPARVAEIVAGRDVWIHVDWDVLEPGYIPAAYRVGEGLLPHRIAGIFAALSPEQVRGVELAEFEDGDSEVPARVSVELILETFLALRL